MEGFLPIGWAAMLAVIGVTFNMGVNSIKAIRRDLGYDVTDVDVYSMTMVAVLAAIVVTGAAGTIARIVNENPDSFFGTALIAAFVIEMFELHIILRKIRRWRRYQRNRTG
jgi:hypothetical protein